MTKKTHRIPYGMPLNSRWDTWLVGLMSYVDAGTIDPEYIAFQFVHIGPIILHLIASHWIV